LLFKFFLKKGECFSSLFLRKQGIVVHFGNEMNLSKSVLFGDV